MPLKKGGWVDFGLAAKFPLTVTKPNCRRSLNEVLQNYHALVLDSMVKLCIFRMRLESLTVNFEEG